jgi:hypothetical protein
MVEFYKTLLVSSDGAKDEDSFKELLSYLSLHQQRLASEA